MKIPRKKKKAFKKWCKSIRGITLNPTQPNSVEKVLEDLYSLFKNRNYLGKPLYSAKRK